MSRVSSNWYYHFSCMARHAQITPNNKFAITLQYQEVIDKRESLLQIDTTILMGMVQHSQSCRNSKFTMSIQYLEKDVKDEVDFLHTDKHQSVLRVYFDTLGIRVSYKLTLWLVMGIIKHSESTQSNKFPISF